MTQRSSDIANGIRAGAVGTRRRSVRALAATCALAAAMSAGGLTACSSSSPHVDKIGITAPEPSLQTLTTLLSHEAERIGRENGFGRMAHPSLAGSITQPVFSALFPPDPGTLQEWGIVSVRADVDAHGHLTNRDAVVVSGLAVENAVECLLTGNLNGPIKSVTYIGLSDDPETVTVRFQEVTLVTDRFGREEGGSACISVV